MFVIFCFPAIQVLKQVFKQVLKQVFKQVLKQVVNLSWFFFSFPATPAPSPFSPSPAQFSAFSPDQVCISLSSKVGIRKPTCPDFLWCSNFEWSGFRMDVYSSPDHSVPDFEWSDFGSPLYLL